MELAALTSYAALFGSAFLAATLLPAQSELVLSAMIASGRFDVTALLLVATTGNTLGAVVNWGLQRTIETFRNRRWFPVSAETLRRGEAVYERWGNGRCCCRGRLSLAMRLRSPRVCCG